jgi:hypothetical protein
LSCSDQGGRQTARQADACLPRVLGHDGGGGAVLRAHVEVVRGVGRPAQRVVVDHQVGDNRLGQLVVAGARLRVDEGEMTVTGPVERAHVLQGEAKAAHHLAVLGPPDDAAVRDGRLAAERRAQDARQNGGRGQGVGIRIVVGEDQPGASRRADMGRELGPAIRRVGN